MPVTVHDVKQSMDSMIGALQKQLDDLSDEMFTVLPNGTAKYTPAARAELNNVRSKLSQEIFHRQLVAAFDEATVQVVQQPTQTEVKALQTTLTQLGKPLDQLNDFRVIVGFVEGIMTDTANRFNELTNLLQPMP
jgi:uncharacterized protein YukE